MRAPCPRTRRPAAGRSATSWTDPAPTTATGLRTETGDELTRSWVDPEIGGERSQVTGGGWPRAEDGNDWPESELDQPSAGASRAVGLPYPPPPVDDPRPRTAPGRRPRTGQQSASDDRPADTGSWSAGAQLAAFGDRGPDAGPWSGDAESGSTAEQDQPTGEPDERPYGLPLDPAGAGAVQPPDAVRPADLGRRRQVRHADRHPADPDGFQPPRIGNAGAAEPVRSVLRRCRYGARPVSSPDRRPAPIRVGPPARPDTPAAPGHSGAAGQPDRSGPYGAGAAGRFSPPDRPGDPSRPGDPNASRTNGDPSDPGPAGHPSQPGQSGQPGPYGHPGPPGQPGRPGQYGASRYPGAPGTSGGPSEPGLAEHPSQPGQYGGPGQPGEFGWSAYPGAPGGERRPGSARSVQRSGSAGRVRPAGPFGWPGHG